MFRCVQEVSAFYRVLPDATEKKSASWLVSQYDWVLEYECRLYERQTNITELATLRAITRAFGGKVEDLDFSLSKKKSVVVLPKWQEKYLKANNLKR